MVVKPSQTDGSFSQDDFVTQMQNKDESSDFSNIVTQPTLAYIGGKNSLPPRSRNYKMPAKCNTDLDLTKLIQK
jgi:hypothetical protein